MSCSVRFWGIAIGSHAEGEGHGLFRARMKNFKLALCVSTCCAFQMLQNKSNPSRFNILSSLRAHFLILFLRPARIGSNVAVAIFYTLNNTMRAYRITF